MAKAYAKWAICVVLFSSLSGCAQPRDAGVAVKVSAAKSANEITLHWRLENHLYSPIWIPLGWENLKGQPAVVLVPQSDIAVIYADFRGLFIDPPPSVLLSKVLPGDHVQGRVTLKLPIEKSHVIDNLYTWKEKADLSDTESQIKEASAVQVFFQYWLGDPLASGKTTGDVWNDPIMRAGVVRSLIEGQGDKIFDISDATKKLYRVAMSPRMPIAVPLSKETILYYVDEEKGDDDGLF